MSTFGDITINGRATQSLAARNPNDLVRLQEAQQLLQSMLAGDWNATATYTRGMLVMAAETPGGGTGPTALWLLQAASSVNQEPAKNPTLWTLVLAGGMDGVDGATVYIAFATDASGTGFSLTPFSGATYIAFASSTTALTTASAFAGFWMPFVGGNGTNGTNGTNGLSAYVAFASDASGTGFSLTPASGLNYIAFATSATPLTTADAFAGLWRQYVGANGTNGAAGANGSSVYVAYATDASGIGFSLTPFSGSTCLAIASSATPLTTADAFAGLWQPFVGATGAAGAAGATGAAGASVYGYVAYASDSGGTGFSLTPGSGLNYIAILLSNTVITTPSAGNFTGLWKLFASPIASVASPVTLSGGQLGINASSANTANFVVQRDASGNFTAGTVTMAAAVVGSATLSFASGAFQINTPVVMTALTIGSLSGMLVASGGAISGGADTNSLPEGTVNLAAPTGNAYFSRARVLATPLTGLGSANILAATDTVLAAFGKLDNVLGGNFPSGTVTGNFTITGNLAVSGTATLGTLSGILKAANGLVTGGATTDNLTEGTTNVYWTQTRFNTAVAAVVGVAHGLAPLDSSGKVPLANLYAYGATPYGAASQSSMLALSAAKQGDFAMRSDTGITYVLSNNSPALLGSWIALSYPVVSVNGATGVVVLTSDNVTVGTTNLYWTQTLFNNAIAAIKGAASGICSLDSNSLVPVANLPPVGNGIWTANSQSVQTNLTTALKGDLCNRTDQNLTYVLSNNTPTSFGSWTPLLYPVASVNGATGVVVLTSDNVTEGSTNLYHTNARTIAATLTGFMAGTGTITSADTVLSAVQKLAGALAATSSVATAGGTMTGALNFSGTTNRGIVVSQLSTSQIGSLAATSGYNGTIVYDVTLNQLKALVNGSWTSLASGASLPLTAGSGSPLTGALYFQNSTATFSIAPSSGDTQLNILNSGTIALAIDTSNIVHAPNGYFDTGSSGGYKINGNTVLSISSSQVVINYGGTWTSTLGSSAANWQTAYNGSAMLTVDQSGNTTANGSMTATAYKVSGTQVVGAQHAAIADYSTSSTWTDTTAKSDFDSMVTTVNDVLAMLRTHGLIAA